MSMKPYVVGFTIVRNAQKYDYPVVESIRSILPICDEFIVSVGNSEDDTEALIRSINSDKIRIIHSVWDDSLREGGKVLAVETDKAFDAIPAHADWAFYLQADEVVHEKHHATILQAMQQYKDNTQVEGLLFKYKHFYGSYQYFGSSRKWYRREIRVIRNNKQIRAYRDAQGFRINGKKLQVKLIDAEIYHYGWVKNPMDMATKQVEVGQFWAGNGTERITVVAQPYDYSQIDKLAVFSETHPEVMQARINRVNWDFQWDTRQNRMKTSYKILHFIENLTGIRLFEYKNYKII